jgi:thiol:disulfide interchange protein DsbD
MKTTLLTIALFFVTLFSNTLFAQMAQPVKWTITAEKVGDNVFEVKAIADIQDGWFVYSRELEGEGPVPTRVEIERNPIIELNGSTEEIGQKKEEFDNNYDMKVVKLLGKVTFIQRVKINGAAEAVRGKVSYQTCNGHICIPPADVPFALSLR